MQVLKLGVHFDAGSQPAIVASTPQVIHLGQWIAWYVYP